MYEDLKRLKEIVKKIEKKTGKKFKSLNLKLSLDDEGFPLDSFEPKDIKIKDLDKLKGDYPFDYTIYYDYEDEAIEAAIKDNLEYVKKEKAEARKKLKTLGTSKKDKEEKLKQEEILKKSEDYYLKDSEEIFLWLDLKTITFGDVDYSLSECCEGASLEEELSEEDLSDLLTILEDKVLSKNISTLVELTYEESQELDEDEKPVKKKQDIGR